MCGPKNPVYSIDEPRDIEDLGSLSDGENLDNEEISAQWRQALYRAENADIQWALEHEDEYLKRQRIPVSSRTNELEHKETMVQEDQLWSKSRVRRDHVVTVKQLCKQQKEQKQQLERCQLSGQQKHQGQPQQRLEYNQNSQV